MSEQKVIDALKGVIEANTAAMKDNARASEKMAEQVKGLQATIQGAQRKIGGELGTVIERQKKAAKDLEDEVAKVRESGGLVAS